MSSLRIIIAAIKLFSGPCLLLFAFIFLFSCPLFVFFFLFFIRMFATIDRKPKKKEVRAFYPLCVKLSELTTVHLSIRSTSNAN